MSPAWTNSMQRIQRALPADCPWALRCRHRASALPRRRFEPEAEYATPASKVAVKILKLKWLHGKRPVRIRTVGYPVERRYRRVDQKIAERLASRRECRVIDRVDPLYIKDHRTHPHGDETPPRFENLPDTLHAERVHYGTLQYPANRWQSRSADVLHPAYTQRPRQPKLFFAPRQRTARSGPVERLGLASRFD